MFDTTPPGLESGSWIGLARRLPPVFALVMPGQEHQPSALAGEVESLFAQLLALARPVALFRARFWSSASGRTGRPAGALSLSATNRSPAARPIGGVGSIVVDPGAHASTNVGRVTSWRLPGAASWRYNQQPVAWLRRHGLPHGPGSSAAPPTPRIGGWMFSGRAVPCRQPSYAPSGGHLSGRPAPARSLGRSDDLIGRVGWGIGLP